jgi:hypothetical protein
MSEIQILVLAIVVVIGVAGMRVLRVRAGRWPHPDNMLVFLISIFLVPPIAFGVVASAGSDPLRGVPSVALYIVVVSGLLLLMATGASIVDRTVPGRARPLIVLALAGREPDPDDARLDPPVTARLAESVAAVERSNAAFPRGVDFPGQVDRPDFRVTWDALERATAALEGLIADDRGQGVAVASVAVARAVDARGRLDMLRTLTLERGRAWAS